MNKKTEKSKFIITLQLALMLLIVIFGIGAARAATFTVNTTADADDSVCDAANCTLREAINAANAQAGDDTITFDAAVFSAPQTIFLNGARLPYITDNLTINGTGADKLAVSGNNQSGVFGIFASVSVSIKNLTIENGNATDCPGFNFLRCGGGIANRSGTVSVENISFAANQANDYGGAINNYKGTINVLNSTFSGNSSFYGGGLYTETGTLNFTNSTFSGNSAHQGGGVDVTFSSTAAITNTTFYGNSGGSVYVQSNSTADIRNSIITRTTAGGDCGIVANSAITGNSNLIDDTTCGSDPSFRLGAVTNLDPILKNNGGQTPTHALLPGSNAIDAGSNADAPPTDQRGVARPQDGNGDGVATADIGAFELENAAPTSREQCKNGGWMNFTAPRRFKNQGDCIQFVNTGK